jgi:hypothetical protein
VLLHLLAKRRPYLYLATLLNLSALRTFSGISVLDSAKHFANVNAALQTLLVIFFDAKILFGTFSWTS